MIEQEQSETLLLALGVKAEQLPRARLATALGAGGWATPDRPVSTQVERPAGAPSWWVSDEEASQSFLRATGLT